MFRKLLRISGRTTVAAHSGRPVHTRSSMASDHDDRPLIVVNGTLENLSEEDSAFFRMHYRIEVGGVDD